MECKRNLIQQMIYRFLVLIIFQYLQQMLEQDEMFRMFVTKYAPKMGKAKKQASYMLQKKEVKEMPLDQAIKIKQDASKMEDAYDPMMVEKYWDKWWNQNKFFHADANSNNPKKFSICLPPPNVTGYLHIGHALTIAVQDSITRRKRMEGYETLFVPGTDHAGIATQTVVEKMLMKETGKNRHDLGRQAFIQKVWQWKEKHGNRIQEQLRRVGASLDWDRQVFTMDSNLSGAVSEGFTQLFDKGLIYRANRLVNWSCALKTAISDIEVEYQDIEKRTMVEVPGYDKKVQFGVMVYFSYKLKEDPTKQLIVATTRIETMLADVAVAVHPNDARYKDWIGKELIHPLIPERNVRVIADDFVQMDFGTGAVKITPAHDPNDYSCGQRKNLQFINLFTEDGYINENGGKFAGMKRFQCRRIIEDQLKKVGSWKQKKDHKMRLGTCQRSKDVIEPMIKPQWYVNCSEISKPMIEAVKTKKLKIIPVEEEETWYRWIGGLRDWCISRQLWWGHRIPAYLAWKKGNAKPDSQNSDNWVAARNPEQAIKKAAQKLNLNPEQIEIEQDHDVLDTWFSSGLFPFSPLGWPNTQKDDLKQFFPNSILETGHDILFFWVARMVMMSLWLTDKLPFEEVLLHPLVCDSQGHKMSKSRGNVIDPLEIIEGTPLENLVQKVVNSNLPKGEKDKSIKNLAKQFPQGISQCGSDGLRFGLLSYMSQSRSINLNIKNVEKYRKFCNKIWNSFKFSMAKFQFIKSFDASLIDPRKQNFLNSWILAKLDKAIALVNSNFDKYTLGGSATSFHNFWLYELCDIYLEATKPLFISGTQQEKQHAAMTLFICLETGMRLLHPMMPFVSEQLYQKLPDFPGKCVTITKAPYPTTMQEKYPGVKQHFDKIEQQFDIVTNFAASLRSIAASVNLPPQIKPHAFIITNEEIIKSQTDLLATLGKCSKINIIDSEEKVPKGCGIGIIGNSKLYLQISSHIDVNKQMARINKKLAEIAKLKEGLQKKLDDKNRDKIPEKVKIEQNEQMQKYTTEETNLQNGLEKIKQLL